MEGKEQLGVPEPLVKYSEWWGRTYGRDATPEEIDELIGFANALRGDPEFEKALVDSVYYDLYSTPKGGEWNEVTYQRWLLIHALSSYGQKFGLRVD